MFPLTSAEWGYQSFRKLGLVSSTVTLWAMVILSAIQFKYQIFIVWIVPLGYIEFFKNFLSNIIKVYIKWDACRTSNSGIDFSNCNTNDCYICFYASYLCN